MYTSNSMARNNKGQSIQQKLEDEKQMCANTHTLSRRGIQEGVLISLRGHGADEPHLYVGGRRIFLDRTHPSLYLPVSADMGIVRRADIDLVGPESNPFRVLRRVYGEAESALVVINHGADSTFRFKREIAVLNCWHGVSGTAEVLCQSEDEALVRFSREGQTVSAMFPDGTVTTLIFMDGRVNVIPLTTEEMAKVRIEHAARQLETADQRRWDGVVWGIIKMLNRTKGDLPARTVLVEFLKRNEISDLMRAEIRSQLQALGDQRSLSGWWDVKKPSRQTDSQKSTPSIDQEAKRNARRAEDAALRLKMKGSGGGGGGNKRGQKKEGKKGKR